jgi:hypothetical protein
MTRNLEGKRVKLVTQIEVEIEAVVEAQVDNGVVLRVDPATAVTVPSAGSKLSLAKFYKGEGIENPDDPNLQWLGGALLDKLTVLDS